MRDLRFVTAHRGDAESFRQTHLYGSMGDRYHLYAKLDNEEGLSKCYNRFLDGNYESFASFGRADGTHKRDDIVVFLHDDVEMLGNNVEKELNRWADEGFAILGLAGGRAAQIKAPALWHVMTPQGAHSGVSIFHNVWFPEMGGTGDAQPDQPFPTPYGRLGEVLFVDGLFMGIVLEQVTRIGWRFDEDFEFHHYDLGSCLNARKAGLKLRTVFVPVVHWSPGLTAPSEQFTKSEAKFLAKFGNSKQA